MNLKFLPWLTFGTLVGVFLGFAGGKGSPEAPMIVGGVGATLGLAGFCIVSMVHKALKLEDSTTDHDAIAGAFVGTICGGFIGAARPYVAALPPVRPFRKAVWAAVWPWVRFRCVKCVLFRCGHCSANGILDCNPITVAMLARISCVG